MPELPEVETTRRGLAPYLLGETVAEVIVRKRDLRWPVSKQFDKELPGREIRKVARRGKYLLIHVADACMILHLGMSGSARILFKNETPRKHDHVDLVLGSGTIMRFNDPRRFGSIHWTREDPLQHPLIVSLGPEPLSDAFNVDYLYNLSRKRKQNIKTFIMDSKVVVGVGNIYASESLFQAGIHPKRQAGKVSRQRYEKLIAAIKKILNAAIRQGGTTLRDFVNSDGKPGYFAQQLSVYGKTGQVCVACDNTIQCIQLGQRSTFYCSHCQK